MSKIQFQTAFFFLFVSLGSAQPYVDIASFTYQHFGSTYKNNPEVKNQTDDYLLHLFYPKELKNGNVFLFRVNAELLHSSINSEVNSCSDVSSVALSMGFQRTSKDKKWKTILVAIPKIASNFEGSFTANDLQYGGLIMENYTVNPNLKIKAGLYYNREAFGNFFVPILGLDWKATDRMYFYGIIPSNYKMEYNAVKDKLYTGLDFKWLTRSFNLSGYDTENYMRFDEIFLKGFVEYFIYKNVLLSAEAGYSFGKSPLQYDTANDEVIDANGMYSPLKNYPLFNIGISYRLRNESTR